jgi:hypothetical protein
MVPCGYKEKKRKEKKGKERERKGRKKRGELGKKHTMR